MIKLLAQHYTDGMGWGGRGEAALEPRSARFHLPAASVIEFPDLKWPERVVRSCLWLPKSWPLFKEEPFRKWGPRSWLHRLAGLWGLIGAAQPLRTPAQ